MTSTIYASFAELALAEKATGALLDHGLTAEDISMIANTSEDQLAKLEEKRRSTIEVPPTDEDIANNEVTGTSYGHAIVNDQGYNLVHTSGLEPAGYGADMAGGIESTDAVTHYKSGPEPFRTDDGAPTEAGRRAEYVTETTPVAPTTAEVIDATTPVEDRPNLNAKSGITTTTAHDASIGAAKGAAAGLGIGVLAGIACVFLPGIGWVMGAGALATALAGALGATGAGAIAGGVMGYLKDQGIPEEALTVYRDTFDRGGVLLSVNVPTDFNRADIEAVLAKYGAQNIDLYGEVRT